MENMNKMDEKVLPDTQFDLVKDIRGKSLKEIYGWGCKISDGIPDWLKGAFKYRILDQEAVEREAILKNSLPGALDRFGDLLGIPTMFRSKAHIKDLPHLLQPLLGNQTARAWTTAEELDQGKVKSVLHIVKQENPYIG